MNTFNKTKLVGLALLIAVGAFSVPGCDAGSGVLTSQVSSNETSSPQNQTEQQNPDDGQQSPDERESYHGVDKFIGEKLINYPGGVAVGYKIAGKRFEEMSQTTQNRLRKLPLYSIKYDSKQLESALAFFEEKFGAFTPAGGASKSAGSASMVNDGKEVLLVNQKLMLTMRQDTSTIEFYDSTVYSSLEHDVQEQALDYKRLLSLAQVDYSHLLRDKFIESSFLYRFDLLMHSVGETTENATTFDTVGGVDLMLDPAIGNIPILGSGAPARLSYLPDGTLVSAYAQFVQFESTNQEVDLFSSEQALSELNDLLEQDGLSLDTHHIEHALFGYMYPVNDVPVKWLVPSYSFVVAPNEGIMDRGRVYSFPASKNPEAIKAFRENTNLIEETYRELYDSDNIHDDNHRTKRSLDLQYLFG